MIYMHRYRSDTVGTVLNDYLRDFRTKLSARLDNTRFRVELEATKHARGASTEDGTRAHPCLSARASPSRLGRRPPLACV